MLTARNVVLGAIVVAILSLVLSCVALMRSLDSGGLGGDSFGTRAHGQRALFETLADIGVPVERLLVPPTAALDRQATLVFWRPHAGLVRTEPAYLQAVADWVKRGGRVVVAPDPAAGEFFGAKLRRGGGGDTDRSILEILGLPQVELLTVDLEPPAVDDASDAGESGGGQTSRAEKPKEKTFTDDLHELGTLIAGRHETVPDKSVAVERRGSLEAWEGVGEIMAAGSKLRVIEIGTTEAAGRIVFRDHQDEVQTIVAAYKVGEGEVVVIASPAIAENRLLAQADNSVLATRLLAVPGRSVVFDEFYHGLTIRGNPLWLITRPGYSIATLCLLGLVGVTMWRQAVFLGPPLDTPAAGRRSIGEYVDAMARFLNQGASSRQFLLREVRDGVLHAVRQELNLTPGQEKAEELAAVLARRDPRRAGRLLDAVGRIDETASGKDGCSEQETVQLLQEISHCL